MDIYPKRPNRLSVPQNSPDKEIQFFSCSYPDCGYKRKEKYLVARHERLHNPSTQWHISCRVCFKVFGSLVSFLHHMSSGDLNKLFCPWCPFSSGEDFTGFKAHILAHSYTFKSSNEKSTNEFHSDTSLTLKEDLSEHHKSKHTWTPNPSVQAESPNEIPKRPGNSKQTDESSQDQREESSCLSNPDPASVGSFKAPTVSKSSPEARVRHEKLHCSAASCSSFTRKENPSRQQKKKSCSSSSSMRKSVLKIKPEAPENRSQKFFDSSRFAKPAEATPSSPQLVQARVRRPHKIKLEMERVKQEKQEQDQNGADEKVLNDQRALFCCKNCSFKTFYVDNWRKHHRVHTGERPFKCPKLGCDYKARWVQNLRRHLRRSCRDSKIKRKATIIVDTKENLRSATKSGNKIQLDVESRSSSMAFACMLCHFIGDSELSAFKHARQHKIAVIRLNRID